MRWLKIAIAVLIGMIVLVVVIGLVAPRGHTATTRATYARPVSEVWDVISKVEAWPQWNPEVKSVAALPARNGQPVYNVVGEWGGAPTEIMAEPPTRLRTVMDAGGFSGSWTYELEPRGDSTVVSITEQGEVDNPVFRALMLVLDKHATMMRVHEALAARLRVEVAPQRVESAKD